MVKFTLTKVASFLKSEWLLILLGSFSITVFILTVFSFTKSKTPEIPPGTPWRNNILAGITTKEELEAKLGSPIKTEEKEGQISYFYSSDNEFRPHEIQFIENTIEIIKEQVVKDEKGNLNNYLQQYGQPEAELFGKHGTFAPGHFWGKSGLLVFANKSDGTIIEIWYFAPTTQSSFLSQNPEFKLEPPQIP